ncbi:MAG TPA: AAA family ATPase [Gammaproteobacteria bacterium]|nr:AAA family ATPase [Gammaproteobacteria bacterium]
MANFRRHRRQGIADSDLPDIARLWLLRMLVPLGGHQRLISSHSFCNDAIAEAVGLAEWIDPPRHEFDPAVVRKALREQHRLAERKWGSATVSPELAANVARLAALVNLTQADCRVLEFAVSIHNESLLDDAADLLGALSSAKVCQVLSVVLDLPEGDIRQSLGSNGALTKSGLVSVDRNGVMPLRNKLDLLSESFADSVAAPDADPVALLRNMVMPAAPAELTFADYEHVGSRLTVLRSYLAHASDNKRRGVNVFIYGPPGTGKSQLARVLAEEHGCELFEVASEDDDGDPINGERRLRAFRAAQSFFERRQSLIVFDEAEDVFSDTDHFFGHRSIAQKRKGWVNRMLEDNGVPTLWLSNSVQGLDPAFVRRFDMIFELPVPPRHQRERILQKACSGMIDAATLKRVAECEELAPAVITRAATVARAVGDELGASGRSEAFELLINNTLEAQGHKPVRRQDPNRLPQVYDPAFVRADADLEELAAGLARAKAGRLCLYGPPGTGKTAFARWLAEQLALPLIVKRASDLMSMWVGGNEKNIARAFRQAGQAGAILLIDEIDSFLQDRRQAQRGWEVTLVNEMLTQMESFGGVFIASTNLVDGLDQAALRRFDLKVKFDYMRPEQGWDMLHRYCRELDIGQPGEQELARLGSMPNLTPGDFAAAIRQARFRPIKDAGALVDALVAECALKEGAKVAIGFIQ